MPDSLSPMITDQGLQTVFNASNNGFEATITHIALGDGGNGNNGGYQVPVNGSGHATQTALRNEQQRAAIKSIYPLSPKARGNTG